MPKTTQKTPHRFAVGDMIALSSGEQWAEYQVTQIGSFSGVAHYGLARVRTNNSLTFDFCGWLPCNLADTIAKPTTITQ